MFRRYLGKSQVVTYVRHNMLVKYIVEEYEEEDEEDEEQDEEEEEEEDEDEEDEEEDEEDKEVKEKKTPQIQELRALTRQGNRILHVVIRARHSGNRSSIDTT